ncbi:hypothetical protein GCM10009127_24890 [Alteraurantiacibacter aestuarii]|uniref:YceI family protein n=1 Tax=Alteraurantiacibacter aestuarii TaxID=650004 RepID=UPI0031DF7870
MSFASRFTLAASTLALAACSTAPAEEAPLAGDWALSPQESHLSFVTVKAGEIAEAHSFTGLSGAVSAAGAANLSIDLTSVETNVDVRNERMRDFLFNVAEFPSATATVQLDPAAFATLGTGDTLTQDVTGQLDLHGVTADIASQLSVTRIAPDKVRVETVSPIIVSAASFGLDGGVEELRNLANLDAITGQVPVTFSLTFQQQ